MRDHGGILKVWFTTLYERKYVPRGLVACEWKKEHRAGACVFPGRMLELKKGASGM